MGWPRQAKLTCDECRDFYRKRQRPPPCDTHCNMPGLVEENFPVWEVLQTVGGALFDGWGGINLDNAESVARGLGHPWDKEMIQKIIAAAEKLREK